MLNREEADAAVQALPHASEAPVKKRAAIREANKVAEEGIKGQFKTWLAHEYASEFSVNTQELIWKKAWSAGHHAGFGEVESHYETFAEFAEAVSKAENVSGAVDIALGKATH